MTPAGLRAICHAFAQHLQKHPVYDNVCELSVVFGHEGGPIVPAGVGEKASAASVSSSAPSSAPSFVPSSAPSSVPFSATPSSSGSPAVASTGCVLTVSARTYLKSVATAAIITVCVEAKMHVDVLCGQVPLLAPPSVPAACSDGAAAEHAAEVRGPHMFSVRCTVEGSDASTQATADDLALRVQLIVTAFSTWIVRTEKLRRQCMLFGELHLDHPGARECKVQMHARAISSSATDVNAASDRGCVGAAAGFDGAASLALVHGVVALVRSLLLLPFQSDSNGILPTLLAASLCTGSPVDKMRAAQCAAKAALDLAKQRMVHSVMEGKASPFHALARVNIVRSFAEAAYSWLKDVLTTDRFVAMRAVLGGALLGGGLLGGGRLGGELL